MSYLNIDNLYKDQAVLMFRECYAMEKIHGCVRHDTKIMLDNGNEKCIDELYGEETVLSYDESSKQFVPAKIERVLQRDAPEHLDWYSLIFDNGRTLTCTADHPILTYNRRWVPASNLVSTDEIVAFSTEDVS